MWNTIYEGNADCPVASKITSDLNLKYDSSMGYIPSEETPENIKTYNLPGRLNDLTFDHLLIIQEWSE